MILAWLLLLTGLVISGVAIYYSVVGLTAIFSAAVVPIIIMGSALEVGKLVCASWLKANWERAPRFMKYYMITAVLVLMFITSMGIFGFLSKAHNDQNLVSGDVQSKIAIYDEKIKTAKENIEASRKQLKQMDEAVDQVMARSTTEQGADRANAIRRSQQRDRANIAKDIEANQRLVAKLNEEAAPIRAEIRKVEAEVGPIKYIAKFIYGDKGADENMLEQAVTWIIILIVIVFDPLAVIMLLAAQMTFGWFRDEKIKLEQPKEEPKEQPKEVTGDEVDSPAHPVKIFNNPGIGVIAQEVAQVIPEAVTTDDENQGKYEPLYCYKCNTELVNAPGIGYFCPNKNCDVLDGPFDPDQEPITFTPPVTHIPSPTQAVQEYKEDTEEPKVEKKTRTVKPKRNKQREEEQSILLTQFIESTNSVKAEENPSNNLPSDTVKREGSQDDLDNKYQEMVQDLQPEKQSKYRRKPGFFPDIKRNTDTNS